MQKDYRDTYITRLLNARALEVQATQLLSRQINCVQSDPVVEAALRRHLTKTEQQRARLDAIMEADNISHSSVRDLMTCFMAVTGQSAMQDETMKNAQSDYASEPFQIASYKSLPELGGDTQGQQAPRTFLPEVKRMAQWGEGSLDATTRKYAMLRARGEKAGI